MRRVIPAGLLAVLLLLSACTGVVQSTADSYLTASQIATPTTQAAPDGTTPPGSNLPATPTAGFYETIDQVRAKAEMDTLTATGKPFVLLDVRRADEFAISHIAGAILLPNEEIGDSRPTMLPDLSVPIYVYCRSGNRSLQAAKKLAALGYTVYDFGGILTWPYGTV